LPTEDVAADLPVKQHEFAVDGERGALLCGMDARLQFGQPIGIAGGR
jgi:hypothetical protein